MRHIYQAPHGPLPSWSEVRDRSPLRPLVGYERSVHRRSDEVLKRILKRSDFDRKPILLAERGTGLVCHNPERGPSATEALRYWPVLGRWACNLP